MAFLAYSETPVVLISAKPTLVEALRDHADWIEQSGNDNPPVIATNVTEADGEVWVTSVLSNL